jgi:hypothetical protein
MLSCQPELEEVEEHRLEPHAATMFWTSWESVCQEDLVSLIWAQNQNCLSETKDRYEWSNTQRTDWCSSHHLEHSVQNVLAQTERCPHHNSIKMGGLLESNRTPTSLWPEVGHNYFCQELVHRGKSSNTDLRVGLLLPLRSRTKEITEKVMLGASTPRRKGTPETGKIGTLSTEQISWGSTWMVCPLTIVCMIRPLWN